MNLIFIVDPDRRHGLTGDRYLWTAYLGRSLNGRGLTRTRLGRQLAMRNYAGSLLIDVRGASGENANERTPNRFVSTRTFRMALAMLELAISMAAVIVNFRVHGFWPHAACVVGYLTSVTSIFITVRPRRPRPASTNPAGGGAA